MAVRIHEDYNLVEMPEGKNTSDFLRTMRESYERTLKLPGHEAYDIDDTEILIDFDNGDCSLRVFGDEEKRENLLSKLQNETGFIFEGVNEHGKAKAI
tara:strand:+ start:1331 stop:1624 length:294 start_codon:yes stop_codon:yes gene_type:complete